MEDIFIDTDSSSLPGEHWIRGLTDTRFIKLFPGSRLVFKENFVTKPNHCCLCASFTSLHWSVLHEMVHGMNCQNFYH